MPDPAAEPPALPTEPLPGPGIVTLSTSLLGDLQVPGSPEQAATLQALAARAAVYATRASGDGTRRTYRSAWRAYEAWCASLCRPSLAGDPETIAMYAVHAADRGLSLSSLRVALAAIQAATRAGHAARGHCPHKGQPPGPRHCGGSWRPGQGRKPRWEPAIAPCCCWALQGRCADQSWSAWPAATSRWCRITASAC